MNKKNIKFIAAFLITLFASFLILNCDGVFSIEEPVRNNPDDPGLSSINPPHNVRVSEINMGSTGVVDPTKHNIQWDDNSDDEDGFIIERSADGADFVKLGSVGANTVEYPVENLQPDVEYVYRVKAFIGDPDNPDSESAYDSVNYISMPIWSINYIGGVGASQDKGSWADLALDGNNNPHVVYNDNNASQNRLRYSYYDGTYWHSYDTALIFATAPDFSNLQESGRYSSIAVDSNNAAHISCEAEYNGNGSPKRLMYAKSVNNGGWDGIATIHHSGGPMDWDSSGGWSSIACLTGGKPVIAHCRRSYNSGAGSLADRLLFSEGGGNNWPNEPPDNPKVIIGPSSEVANFSDEYTYRKISLEADYFGGYHILYYDGENNKYVYSHKFSGDSSWGDLPAFPGSGALDAAMNVNRVDSNSYKVFLDFVYTDSSGVKYRSFEKPNSSNPGTWGDEQTVLASGNVNSSGDRGIAVSNKYSNIESIDIRGICYSTPEGGSSKVCYSYSNDGGSSWVKEEIMDAGSEAPDYFSMEIDFLGEGRVHLVFYNATEHCLVYARRNNWPY